VDERGAGWHFNLSQNKSLRTLETTAASITSENAAPDFLTAVLSTIASPLPLDVIIDYDDYDLDGFRYWAVYLGLARWPLVPPQELDEMARNNLRHEQRFKLYREMYLVRGFRLVLCADVSNQVVEPAVQTLESLVGVEKAGGRLDYLHCEVLIISEKRTPRIPYTRDRPVGYTGCWPVFYSAF
jgi:hypothetical protein